METLTCTTAILLISASFFAWAAVCVQLDRLEARGSGRRTANSVFDRLEARGSSRNVICPVLA